MTLRERYIKLKAAIGSTVSLVGIDGIAKDVDPAKVIDVQPKEDGVTCLYFQDGSSVDVKGNLEEVVAALGLEGQLPRERQAAPPSPDEITATEAKKTKAEAGYVEDAGTENRCSTCKHFIPSVQQGAPQVAACQLVDGAISPDGTCKLYEPAQPLDASAKSDAIGQKIAKLVKEGYGQDQAAAIAYSMERRGELKGNARSVVLRGATGTARMETLGGAEFLAVPVVALVEGVIWPINAPKPEMVPAGVFSVAPQSWNGRPVFCGHPVNAEGEQVSGNTPDKLPSAFGVVQNARTDGKRLLMEAWLDVAKCEKLGGDALATLRRCQSGDPIEISVGAFTLTQAGVGSFGGRSYAETWQELYPDHLALLPPGDEGACSIAMGCGVRAAVAHRIALNSVQWEPMNAPANGILARLGALLGRLGATDSGEPDWARDIEAAEAELEALAGARHNRKDMALVQAVHDQAVELGANCAPKAAGAKPEETVMTKCEKIAAVVKGLSAEVKAKYEAAAKKSSGDIMAAILGQIKEKFGLSDAAAADLENLAESTLAELAGLAMPADQPADGSTDGATPDSKTPPPTAAQPSYSAANPEQWLESAPAEIKQIVADARQRETARKVVLATAIAKKTKEYSEAELKAMSVKELERIDRVCGAATPDVDFGGQAPRAGDADQPTTAPAPPDMASLIAAKGKK